MNDRNRQKNSGGFKLLAERYVEIQGQKLDSEAASEQIKAMPAPKKPEIFVKKKKRKLFWETSFAAVLTALIVLIGGAAASFFIGGLNEAVKYNNDKSESTKPSPQWQAPKLTVNYGKRFEIKETLVDNGQTVYIIEDSLGDDAVITLKCADDVSFEEEELRTGYSNGSVVYYNEESAGYKMMICCVRDTVIEMTCEYETDTLDDLFRSINLDF